MKDSDLALIEYLMKPKPRKTAKPKYWVRKADGSLEGYANKPTGLNSGSYQGKAGSIRRNRKGATRRLANGSRRYVYPWWDENERDLIVSYQAGS